VVRFDPFGPKDKVLLYACDTDTFLGEARYYNRDEKDRTPIALPEKKPAYNYIELLLDQHEAYLKEKTRGIDYAAIPATTRWAFSAFLSTFAELLGKKEGLSAFSTAEIELLKKLYDRYPDLNASMLTEAHAVADTKSIGSIAFALQTFHNQR
jgi:hypothetical protein